MQSTPFVIPFLILFVMENRESLCIHLLYMYLLKKQLMTVCLSTPWQPPLHNQHCHTEVDKQVIQAVKPLGSNMLLLFHRRSTTPATPQGARGGLWSG